MESPLRKLAEKWLLPSIIITIVLGNQPFVALKIVSQFVGWFSDVVALIIVFKAFKKKWWIIILVISIILSKIFRVFTTSNVAEIVYI